MLVILVGKTCSGKSTIAKKLYKNYGIKQIVTYTTRPPRKGEIQDISYHFISEEDFQTKIQNDFFAEYKTYDTANGKWFYGTAKEDVLGTSEDHILILTPAGFKDVKKMLPNGSYVVLYIYANNSTIRWRLKQRGDSKAEADRRILADNEDFKDIATYTDRIFYNNTNCDINEITENIYKYVKGEKV